MNDSDNEVSGRKEEHGRENIHHLREWLNCHEADVNMSMFTRGVAGAFQRERRNNYKKLEKRDPSIKKNWGKSIQVRESLP